MFLFCYRQWWIAVAMYLTHKRLYLLGDGISMQSYGSPTFPDVDLTENSPNFANLFHERDKNLQSSRRDLYQSSQRRQLPSKNNRKHRQEPPMPPLVGQEPLQGDGGGSVGGTSTRSKTKKGSAGGTVNNPPHEAIDNTLLERIPKKPHHTTTKEINEYCLKHKLSITKMNEYADSFAQLDKPLTKPQLQEVLNNQRKRVYCQDRMLSNFQKVKTKLTNDTNELVQQNKNLVQENQDLVDQVQHNQAEHNTIVVDLQLQLRKALARKKTGRVSGKNKEFMEKLIEKAKMILWSQCKFIQSHDEETAACKLLVQIGNFDKKLVDTKQKRADIVETYKVICKKAIFAKRNYVTSEIKKMFMKRLAQGKRVLSMTELEMCIGRNVKTEQDMENFMIYWEDYLPKEVGSMEWSDKVKYYNTISKAKRSDLPDLDLITSHSEAFLVICVFNGMARWTREHERKLEIRAAKAEGRVVEETEEDKQEKKQGAFDGRFTCTTNGQNPWGGWNEDGLELFIDYRARNVLARQSKDCDKVEKDCLARLRVQCGIDADCKTALEHLRKKEAKKRLTKRGRGDEVLPPKKKVVRTMVEVESSEDEAGGQDEEDDE
jgi:hypothetical protein